MITIQHYIDWLEGEITWNNAPANDTDSWTNPDFTHATLMGTVDLTGNFQAGSQHFIDVDVSPSGGYRWYCAVYFAQFRQFDQLCHT